jgi:chromate reductase, NAD(P)H dehydrogenase (quinone)
LSGSLREGSFNAGLLRAAAEVVPDGADVIVGTIRRVPLYDGDVEATAGIPAEVQRLKDQLAAADALLLVTPEYNNGVPGVFKNAINWMTRPASDIPGLFEAKPIAVIGASPGGFGAALTQNHWPPVLRTLGSKPWFGGRMLVSRAGFLFNDKGDLTDAVIRDSLRKFMAGFAAFVAGMGGSASQADRRAIGPL